MEEHSRLSIERVVPDETGAISQGFHNLCYIDQSFSKNQWKLLRVFF